jgi:membrane-associated phospholipid phosphatase
MAVRRPDVLDPLAASAPLSDDPARAGRPPVWWKEVALVAGFYLAYAEIRDNNGRYAGTPQQLHRATTGAMHVVRLEQWLHIFHERALQQAALHHLWLVKLANIFYGSCHFIVTAGVLIWLYRARPDMYRRWRSVLGIGTALALVCFTFLPTLPPRMLPQSYGFVDTLWRYGGLWSFNSGVVEHISDPFAAMPSLHLVWSTWCACVLWAGTRRRSVRALALAYPIVTSVAVVITGNHYILDLVAGTAVFALAWALSLIPAAIRARRRQATLLATAA